MEGEGERKGDKERGEIGWKEGKDGKERVRGKWWEREREEKYGKVREIEKERDKATKNIINLFL